uniref:Uncharacterized protein n=1 Tax=blood disease bacterium R229 TaxID=741978 RepID=G2ZX43_9RALS|nr:hypothetical protein BDB_mp70059 [blood disease bacterium R229]
MLNLPIGVMGGHFGKRMTAGLVERNSARHRRPAELWLPAGVGADCGANGSVDAKRLSTPKGVYRVMRVHGLLLEARPTPAASTAPT